VLSADRWARMRAQQLVPGGLSGSGASAGTGGSSKVLGEAH
jgi:hypothetical protein